MTEHDTADQTEPASYTRALAELETILDGLEGRAVDVDRLAADVRRAAVLITHCRERLVAVQSDVEDIVTDLETSENAPGKTPGSTAGETDSPAGANE